MELGNMIFGNSRGEAPIPRIDAWSAPIYKLLDAAGCEYHGHPGFENAIFKINGYDWDAECDCGVDDRMEEWFKRHPHGAQCYQTACDLAMAKYDEDTGYTDLERAAFGNDRTIFAGMDTEVTEAQPGVKVLVSRPRSDQTMSLWRDASNERHKFQDRLRERLCREHRLSYPDGCAVHCDCGRDAEASAFAEANPHTPICRLIQPNFLHKPSGFRVNWYKYPLRDSYMSPRISLSRWRKIIAECRASLPMAGRDLAKSLP